MQTSLLTAFEKFFARRSAIIPMMLLIDAVFATHFAEIANWFLVSAKWKSFVPRLSVHAVLDPAYSSVSDCCILRTP
jgi:hypothetical protein